MIRFGRKIICWQTLLVLVLLCAVITPLFVTNFATEAGAAMVTDVDLECSYYATGYEGYQASENKGGIIYVGTDLTYSKNGEDGTLAAYKKNPTATNLAAIRMRFYTLSEAFWFIHSGAGEPDKYKDDFREADWVIIVCGKQVFNFNSDYSGSAANTASDNNKKEVPAGRLQAGYNYVYKSNKTDVDDLGNVVSTDGVCATFNIDGSYAFSDEAYTCTSDSYSSTGSWREYEDSVNYTYQHTGTWYITGGYAISPTTATSSVNCPMYNGTGSEIHSSLESTLYFTTGGPTHFSHIEFSTNLGNLILYGDAGLVIGDGVVTPEYTYHKDDNASGNRYLCAIYAGAADQSNATTATQATTVSSSKIVVSSGNWRTIMAGGDRGDITGTSTLRITGDAVVYSNVTLGFNMAVGGDVNFYLDGDACVAYLYASPRVGGSTGGATNVHLIGGSLYRWQNVGIGTGATISGNINAYIYEDVTIFNMNPDWSQENLTLGGSRNLYLVGNQSFVDHSSNIAYLDGFDYIYLQNGCTVNYTGKFKSTADLSVASGCELYLTDYVDDDDLDSGIGDLTNNGDIRYTLLMYVNGSASPEKISFIVIPIGSGTSGSYETVELVQDGYSEKTTWTTLAQAYDAATGTAVDCTFNVWGDTTVSSFYGAEYSLNSVTVSITGDNDAVLTLDAGVNFGYNTVLHNINISATTFYSGKKLTIDEGTVFEDGATKAILYAGLSDRACTSACNIIMNDGSLKQVWLGNPSYNVVGVNLTINNDAYVHSVFCGSTKQTGDLSITVKGTGTNTEPNLLYIYATPVTGMIAGDLTVNLYSGAMGDADLETGKGNLKLYDYSSSDDVGSLTGKITVNVTDEFVYVPTYIFYNYEDELDRSALSDTSKITVNLRGWTGELTEDDVKTYLTYVDYLGAKSYNGTATNAVCYATLPTNLISDATDTTTYATYMDAESGNAMYFHNSDYDYYKVTATSGGTLVYGHNLTPVTSAVTATATNPQGNITYCCCQDSTCNQFFASVADANTDTQISDHNGDTVIDIDDVYRYWYQVDLVTVTNDTGAGGSVSDSYVGADERNAMSAVTAAANTYYSHSGWYTNAACSTSASSLGTVNTTTFTPTTANVKSAVDAVTGSKTGGSITVYVYFTRNLSSLTINRENAGHDTSQVFVYKVSMADTAALPGLTMYVTVTGNSNVVITDLPQGEYTVTQENDWSWRYNGRVNESQIVDVNADKALTFSNNTVINTSWLDANSAIMKVRG